MKFSQSINTFKMSINYLLSVTSEFFAIFYPFLQSRLTTKIVLVMSSWVNIPVTFWHSMYAKSERENTPVYNIDGVCQPELNLASVSQEKIAFNSHSRKSHALHIFPQFSSCAGARTWCSTCCRCLAKCPARRPTSPWPRSFSRWPRSTRPPTRSSTASSRRRSVARSGEHFYFLPIDFSPTLCNWTPSNQRFPLSLRPPLILFSLD